MNTIKKVHAYLIIFSMLISGCLSDAVTAFQKASESVNVNDSLEVFFIQWDIPHTRQRMLIPDGWVSDYYQGVITLASRSQNLTYSPSEPFEGVLITLFVSDGPRAVGPTFDVQQIARDYVSDQLNVVQAPMLVEADKRQIVTTIYLNEDSKGKLITYLTGFIVQEQQLTVFIAATPNETEELYLPVLNEMLYSIEVVSESDY
jgi:hypothetical protein